MTGKRNGGTRDGTEREAAIRGQITHIQHGIAEKERKYGQGRNQSKLQCGLEKGQNRGKRHDGRTPYRSNGLLQVVKAFSGHNGLYLGAVRCERGGNFVVAVAELFADLRVDGCGAVVKGLDCESGGILAVE